MSANTSKDPNGPAVIAAIQQMEKTWLAQSELINFRARIVRQKYMAAVDEGFNETQALYLSTTEWR